MLNYETEHLAEIIAIAQEQLNTIRQNNEQQVQALVEAKRDLRENSSHSISNLWSSDSFYELAALGQYATQVSNRISVLELEANKQLQLEKMVKKPYFARIDFRFADRQSCEQVYIGRSSLLNDSKTRFYVYDWRSPLAGVFYRFGVGEAYYDAPRGRIHGEVSLKRQFEISEGNLEYFFDSDVQIMDEFLKKLLAQNAAPQMKAIVETIQKDQDIIIRDMENDILLVQGVAGSGKTSVALHRVAYLMYQGLTERLSAHNIMVISPNNLFARYIANVLPELGEENVATVTFEELLQNLAGSAEPESRNQLLESLLSPGNREKSSLRRKALAFKASEQFIKILMRFIEDIPQKWLQFSDVEYDGELVCTAAALQDRILIAANEPLQVGLNKLEKSIWEQVHEKRPGRMEKLRAMVAENKGHMFEVEEYTRLLSIEESIALREKIRCFTQLDMPALYGKLFTDWQYFRQLAEGLELPENIEEIWQLSRENLQNEQLPYEDALAMAFLRLRLNGFHQARYIKQVVIDEAQDYYPLHFAILGMLFPHARYTILGDIQQTIEKTADMSLFDSISKILNKEKASQISMTKGFRCTREILNFSSNFLPHGGDMQSFSRQGEEPQIYAAPNQDQLNEAILREIEFCRQGGYGSVGLLCKTEQEAAALYESLREHTDLRLIRPDSISGLRGVVVLPIYMAKGLEFDAVLLCGVDKEQYSCEDDKSLLYIGCTRALHRLNLFCCGEASPLLPAQGGVLA